jgi:hypothetical protein
VTFDLDRGHVVCEGDTRSLLVPATALAGLVASAGADAAARFGREIGAALGRRIATRLGGAGDLGAAAVRGASLEAIVAELGGEVALAGLGALSLERWGRALVLTVDGSPLDGPGDALLEGALGAAVGACSGREVVAVRLAREGQRVRFLVTGAAAAQRLRGWLAGGAPWADALARLHEPAQSVEGSTQA